MASLGPKFRSLLQRRWARWIIGLLAALALYSAGGFMLAPRIIRWQLMKQLPPLTQRQPRVGQVLVNPFRLTLTVSNLSLNEPDGSLFVSVERVFADVDVASVWRGGVYLMDLEVVRPFANLQRRTNGVWNFENLAGTFPASAASSSGGSPLPRIEISNLRLSDGEVGVRDEAIPGIFSKKLSGLTLGFTNLTTVRDSRSPGWMQAAGDSGEMLTWTGDVGLDPPASQGRMRLAWIPLARHGVYLQLATPGRLVDGRMECGMEYAVRWSGAELDARLTNAHVRLRDVAFDLPQSSQPSVTVAELDVENVTSSLVAKQVRVGELRLRDAKITARRTSDGQVDITRAIRPEFIEESLHVLSESFSGWLLELPAIQGERLGLEWRDSHPGNPGTPVSLGGALDLVRIEGLSNQSNRPVSVRVEWAGSQGSTARIGSEGTLLPLRALTQIDFGQVQLSALQPYLADYVNLNLKEGLVSGHWRVGYNQSREGPLITADGETQVDRLLAFDTVSGRDFVRWDALQVKEMRAAWEPASVRIGEIRLVSPATSFVLMTNGQFNALALLKRPPEAASPGGSRTSSPSASMPLTVRVDRLTLTNASLYAADQTVPGEFSNTLERFSGEVTDLDWPTPSRSQVTLAGFVGARAPFRVEGWILPDARQPLLDMHVTTTNAELVPFTPYVLKFAGYPLKEGRITADVKYRVEGRQVQGQNQIRIDRLTLGPRGDSNPVLDLPVKLGVAILKDRNGRITLDIPVKGSLDDPEFGVSKVVWQAVKNLMAKVATAPFRLLGSLFGGSEDEGSELQWVEFPAGATNLTADATRRLERLVKVLQERPELLLSVQGGVSPEEDGPVLARQSLTNAVIQLHRDELKASGTTVPESSPAALSTEDWPRLMARLLSDVWSKAGGTNAAATAAVPAPRAVPADPAEVERELVTQFRPDAGTLGQVAQAREQQVRLWLTSPQRLTADRLVASVPSARGTNGPALRQRRVEFSLE